MRKQLTITILGSGLGLAISSFAAADIVGAGASVGYWYSNLSGEATQGSDRVDVDNALNLDSSDNIQFSAALEHPVPLLPNVRVGFSRIEQTGDGELGASFGDLIAVGDVDVRSELNLDQLDLTLYYEILDNWVNVDGGLTARSIDGELLIEERADRSNASHTEIDVIMPMLYLAARFDLPTTDLSLGAEGNGIGYGGDSIFDISVYGQYDISLLRLQAGYRQMTIDVEDGDESLDIEMGGPFVSVGLDF